METPPLVNELLSCLRAHGQRLDFEIAQELGVPVLEVRARFAALLASGDVISCKLTRFEKGKRLDAMMYRISGYFPPGGPGRKPTSSVVTTVEAASAKPDPDADS